MNLNKLSDTEKLDLCKKYYLGKSRLPFFFFNTKKASLNRILMIFLFVYYIVAAVANSWLYISTSGLVCQLCMVL